jgi:hypothetical protein
MQNHADAKDRPGRIGAVRRTLNTTPDIEEGAS